MDTYRAAVVGCSRMGGFIDNEVIGYPAIVLPYSHAAGYEACERTELVACSDVRTDIMEAFGRRYRIPPRRQYLDYRDLIDSERPDILSIATQPEQRAEIAVYAAEHGVRALYVEKALAASLEEANAIAEAVERHGVVFNMGTNRRWHPGFDRMKQIIHSGELGALRTVIIYANGTLFNTASHTFDLAMWLNDDAPAASVQASLTNDDSIFDGDLLREDPTGHGIIRFTNGVTVYALLTARGSEYEAICERGVLTCLNNGIDWAIRRHAPIDESGARTGLVSESFPAFERASTTLRLIEDIVHALDTGDATRGGVRCARANAELIFAFIESHRRGGARVELPLTTSAVRLERRRAPRQPTFGA